MARRGLLAGLAVSAAAALSSGCSAASTAVVPQLAGAYQAWVVEGANGCQIQGLAEGAATSGVPVTVTQDSQTPQNATLTMGGAPGALLASLVGTDALTGTLGYLQPGVMTATLVPAAIDASVPTVTSGACSYTVSAALNATFAGDTVQGTLIYSFSPSAGSSCPLTSCQSVLAVAGVLAPGDL